MPEPRNSDQGSESTEDRDQESRHRDDGDRSERDDEPFDADRARRTILAQRESEKRLQRELRQAQTALSDVQAKLKEKEQAELSEQERAQARIRELEAREQELANTVRNAHLRGEVTAAAVKAGATKPDVLHRLIDPADIEWDGDKPKNVDALVSDLKRQTPELFRAEHRTGSADGGSRGKQSQGSSSTINAMIRRAAGRST